MLNGGAGREAAGGGCPETQYKQAAARLSKIFAAQDDQGDGELELYEFRDLYRKIFPDRPMTESTWSYTQKLFQQIDIDNSGKICLEEIFLFLRESLDKETRLKIRPQSLADWCYVVCCHGNMSWVLPEERRLRLILHCLRSLEFIFTLVAVVVIMVITLPGNQRAEHDHALRGTRVTAGFIILCLIAFSAHLVGHGYGYCFSDLIRLEQNNEAGPLEWMCSKVALMGVLSIVGLVGYLADGASRWVYFLPMVSLRLIRLAKVLKLFEIATPQLTPALVKGAESLRVLCMLLLTQMCITASFMFYAEVDQASFDPDLKRWVRDNTSDYPDSGKVIQFQSLLDCLWWSIVTITTVGYGDYYPVTIGGKVVAAVTMLGSLVLISYPITILNATIESIESDRLERETRLQRNRELFTGLMGYLRSGEGANAPDANGRAPAVADAPADASLANLGAPAAPLDGNVAGGDASGVGTAARSPTVSGMGGAPSVFLIDSSGHHQFHQPPPDPLGAVAAMTARLEDALASVFDRIEGLEQHAAAMHGHAIPPAGQPPTLPQQLQPPPHAAHAGRGKGSGAGVTFENGVE